jgi:large subunit ribosomal protein L3
MKMSGLLGKKIGMTRIFDEVGNMIPVTVIEAGPCYVTQVKTREKDGYDAVQLGYGSKKEKNTTKPLLGHFKNANTAPQRKLKEFSPFSDREVKIGFAGVVKRHGFSGGPVTHGQSDRLRAPGSLGQSSDPSRVYKGLKMAGRMGNKRASVRSLKVAKVDAEKNLIFIKGAVPGSRNNFVEIYKI